MNRGDTPAKKQTTFQNMSQEASDIKQNLEQIHQKLIVIPLDDLRDELKEIVFDNEGPIGQIRTDVTDIMKVLVKMTVTMEKLTDRLDTIEKQQQSADKAINQSIEQVGTFLDTLVKALKTSSTATTEVIATSIEQYRTSVIKEIKTLATPRRT